MLYIQHVAGVAALFREANPMAGPVEIREMILDSATKDVLQYLGSDSPNLLLNTQALSTTPIQTPPSAAKVIQPTMQSIATLIVIGMLTIGAIDC